MDTVDITLTVTRNGASADTLNIPGVPASEVLNEAGLMSVVKVAAYLAKVSGGV